MYIYSDLTDFLSTLSEKVITCIFLLVEKGVGGTMFKYTVLLALFCALAANANTVPKAGSGFSVKGTTIYDGSGKPFLMRGINHAHTWYKDDLAAAIPAIAATKANVVRIVLSDGGQWNKDDAATVEKIISLLYDNKIVTMLEVHDGTGKDDTASLELAVDYWVEIASVLKGKEDRVIINIANEWYSKDNAKEWGDAYITAVQNLRKAGLTHLIVIDAAGWGQSPDVIASAGPDVFKADSLANTVFSIHMYEVAGKDATAIKTGIDNALAINVPVIVGEFAIQNNGQPVDITDILSYTRQTNVGWLAWSWYGNNEPALDLATGPAGTLTSYGDTIVNGVNGLKETAVPAGIFN